MVMLANYARTATTNAEKFFKELQNLEMGQSSIKEAIIDNFDWFIFKDQLGKILVVPAWAIVWDTKKWQCSTRQNKRTKSFNGRISDSAYRTEVKPSTWIIPSFDNVAVENKPNFALSICNKAQPVETNGYFKYFNIVKEFINNGYEACGLYHGLKMEEIYPILDTAAQNVQYSEQDKVQDVAWQVAQVYAEKINEQKNNRTKTSSKGLIL